MKNYPRPKHIGGLLIRRAIQVLREAGVSLPLSKVVLANSGGADSMALCHLIVKYGRKIVDPKNVIILHINHGWRGGESDGDEEFVNSYSRESGIDINIHRVRPPSKEDLKNESPEALARLQRKDIFSDYERQGYIVLTGHHAEDLAETIIWKLCAGKMDTDERGILVKTGNELRPFLSTRKSEIKLFLKEEALAWREDRTNHEGVLLRSKMRIALMPEIEDIFPQAIENIVKYSLSKQLSKKNKK